MSIQRVKTKAGYAYKVRVRLVDASGAVTHPSKTVRLKKEAEKLEREWQAEIDRGTAINPSTLTLRDYLTGWLAGKAGRVKLSTYTNYRNSAHDYVIPALGTILLQKLTAADVQRFEDHLLTAGRKRRPGGLSRTYVHDIHVGLSSALRDAVRLGLVTRNVAEAVNPPKVSHPPITVWDAAQARAFLAIAEEAIYWPFWLLALTTAMRRGEVLGLRWAHIDLGAGRIHLQENRTAPGGVETVGTPKSGKGRTVAIDARVVRILEQHRIRQIEFCLKIGQPWAESTLVFLSAVGTPIHPFNVTAAFIRILKQHPELPRIRLHDLRHTCATLLLARGVHPKVVSEMLGHANIGITLDLYSHVMPHMQEEAAAILADALLG